MGNSENSRQTASPEMVEINPFQELFERKKAYYNTNVTKTYEWRIEQLDRLERLLTENRSALQEAVGKDFKTAYSEQVFEVSAPISIIHESRSRLREWMEPVEVPIPKFLAASGHRGVIYKEPYGVTLIIGPFNGPLLLLFDPAIDALTAGNPLILKTSNALINTSKLLAVLIAKYFEPDAVAAVEGNHEAITELLKLPFDFIFFTGSVKVGKIILKAAAENLTPVILELGGQNPAIVDTTADIPDAARKIIWGATAWGGQWCTSPGYACVHESVVEEFVKETKNALIEMFGAAPKANPDYSRIISGKEVKRLAALIDPEKVITGGEFDEEAHYLAPTVIYPVSWTDPIMEDEIFGPILPVLAYSDLNEVVANIKKMPTPLSAFIFSTDENIIRSLLNSLPFGGGAVNQTNVHLFVLTMPFGGMGNSGMGHYYGKYGFDAMSHAKSILHAPSGVNIDNLIPPFTEQKVKDLDKWFDY
ncbi:MAG: aldehyde dehydrogenase [Mucilaginibacter sp.]|nr:aldehyde dehydrogenase [Mucilaginibacter sp.]